MDPHPQGGAEPFPPPSRSTIPRCGACVCDPAGSNVRRFPHSPSPPPLHAAKGRILAVERTDGYAAIRDYALIGDGRTTVWIHPRCSVVYKFYGSKRPGINRAWVDALVYTANSPTGLYAVPEPAEYEADGRERHEADRHSIRG